MHIDALTLENAGDAPFIWVLTAKRSCLLTVAVIDANTMTFLLQVFKNIPYLLRIPFLDGSAISGFSRNNVLLYSDEVRSCRPPAGGVMRAPCVVGHLVADGGCQ
jgi:hypothetical protein